MPATIGIINGRIKVGLTDEQFEILAKQPSHVPTIKTSRRDFGHVLGKKLNGGTTVAGTTIIANLVGIEIFATGAIGDYNYLVRYSDLGFFMNKAVKHYHL